MSQLDRSKLDCDAGRRLGCQSFCCRLLVRLESDERENPKDGSIAKGFVDKDPDGFCTFFNRGNQRCSIWADRPKVCRAYECNSDFLLQVAIRSDFSTIAELSKMAACAYIPKETYSKVPLTKTDLK